MINLVVTVVGFSAAMLWVALETPWLPFISGFVGLSGLVVWGATLLNLIDEPSKQAIQRHVQGAMRSPIPTALVCALGLAILATDAVTATVVVDCRSDMRQRSLALAHLGDAEVPSAAPTPGRRTTYLVLQGLRSRPLHVLLSGLPPLVISPTRFSRPVLRSPADFLAQPTILVRPSPDITRFSAGSEFKVTFEVNGQQRGGRYAFDGRAFWIGSRDDTEIPGEVIRSWELSLLADKSPTDWIPRWLPARAIGEKTSLKRGDTVKVMVLTRDLSCYARGTSTIPQTYNASAFPVQIKLEVPRGASPKC